MLQSGVRGSSAAAASTWLDAITAGSGSRGIERAERGAAMLFVVALTAAAAQVSIPLPFTPVPFTMQPMIVLLGGAALGARLGATSQALYLALGIAGLRSEEHTSELQSLRHLVCRLLLEK